MLIGHNNLPRKRCPQWRSLHHFLADNYLSSLLRLLASGFVAVELRTLMVLSPPAFVANVEKYRRIRTSPRHVHQVMIGSSSEPRPPGKHILRQVGEAAGECVVSSAGPRPRAVSLRLSDRPAGRHRSF